MKPGRISISTPINAIAGTITSRFMNYIVFNFSKNFLLFEKIF